MSCEISMRMEYFNLFIYLFIYLFIDGTTGWLITTTCNGMPMILSVWILGDLEREDLLHPSRKENQILNIKGHWRKPHKSIH